MPRPTPPRKDKNRVPRAKRELPAPPKKEAERVAKVVARAGLGSRREIEDWIAEGRVAVNGKVLESPAVTVTDKDVITVDGQALPERERTRLFIYHKPKGVVTTNRDPEGRTTLFEILPKGLPRLVSVGRLDLNSEGLLLLTNDGGLARVLELPETGWLRRYRVRANGEIDQARLDTLLQGITVDGVEYGPIEAVLDRVQGANAWITVALREGKNREVRNVLGALGLKVNRLIRTSYGPFQLGEIPEGAVEEVRTRILRDQIGADIAAAAGADFDGPVFEHEAEEASARPVPRPAGKRQAAAEQAGGLKAPARRGARARDASEAPAEDVIRPSGPRLRRRRDETRELEALGTVSDRKGRAVKVERVVAGKAEAPARGRAARRVGEEGRPVRRPRGDDAGFGRSDRDAPRTGARPPRPRRDEEGPGFARAGAGGKGSGGKGSGGNAAFKGRPSRGEERGPRREREELDSRPRTGRFEERPRRPRRTADEGGFEASTRARRGGGSDAPGEEAPRRRFGGAPERDGKPGREGRPFRGERREAGDKPFRQGRGAGPFRTDPERGEGRGSGRGAGPGGFRRDGDRDEGRGQGRGEGRGPGRPSGRGGEDRGPRFGKAEGGGFGGKGRGGTGRAEGPRGERAERPGAGRGGFGGAKGASKGAPKGAPRGPAKGGPKGRPKAPGGGSGGGPRGRR